MLRRGEKDAANLQLYWDSWDPPHNNHFKTTGLSPRPRRSRAARASVPSEETLGLNNNGERGGAHIPPSASVSSIDSLNASVTQCGVMLGSVPPLTPPPPLTGQGRGKGMHAHVFIHYHELHNMEIHKNFLPSVNLSVNAAKHISITASEE